MNSYVELVPLGPDGQIQIPRHFTHRGAPLRGAYVIPRLARDEVLMLPATKWNRIAEDAMTSAETAIEARRLRRAFSLRAQLTIDRHRRCSLPLAVCRRGRLRRKVVLTLIVDTLAVKPESEFEIELEQSRRIYAEMELAFPESLREFVAAQPTSTPETRRKRSTHPILQTPAEHIPLLSAEELQLFVKESLWEVGLQCSEVGSTFARDGGIDLIAYTPPSQPFPSAMAVQVASSKGSIGPAKVRDFAGAIQCQPVSGGILVTNARFSDQALWWAEQFNEKHTQKLWLRDIADLVKWSQGDFRPSRYTDELRSTLHLYSGGTFAIDNGYMTRRW